MKNNFKDSIKTNISINDKNDNIIHTTKDGFVLKKKQDDKKGKKVFNVYMDEIRLKELDKMCKKSKYSRNELVNMMIDYCLENWSLED